MKASPFTVSRWHRHLPGRRVVELDTLHVHPCRCSRWRLRYQIIAQAIIDAWGVR